MPGFDVAVIGGGIVGLANAWAAARLGLRVVLCERDRAAQGASVRNFGMVWPIGQTAGENYDAALRSRELWLEAIAGAGLWHDPCGSVHLAYREDEWGVLEEFAAASPGLGYRCELLSREETLKRSAAARALGLLGSLYSATEVCVDPREAIRVLPHWLHERYGVVLEFGVAVAGVEEGLVVTTDGRRIAAERILICSGADMQTLYPEKFVDLPVRRCKLQMLRTAPQPAGWRIGPMIASGLTLRHYPTFRICPSLESLQERVARETPLLDRFGIHVMASQNGRGEVVLGDSHEYGEDITPFDRQEIESLILEELHKIIQLRDWEIAARWHGVYVKHPDLQQLVVEARPGVYWIGATGGTGMTMSFGLADKLWQTLA